jgi:hypothetical protein
VFLIALFKEAAMKPILFAAIPLALLLAGCKGEYAQGYSPPVFASRDAAQRHCPRDVVVWSDTMTGTYHMPGDPYYGRALHGAFLDRGGYLCKAEADRSPYLRPGHNLRS